MAYCDCFVKGGIMLSIVLTGARRAIFGLCCALAVPVGAVNLTATSATLDAALNSLASGDWLVLNGTFGEFRLTNRTFNRVVSIDASHATFTTTMVFDNVWGVSLSGGAFNIAGNGSYSKGIALYGGKNIYIDNVTVTGGGTVDQFGIAAQGTGNLQVTNSRFSGLSSGIGIGGAQGGFLAKNSFTAQTSDGIDIADSHGVTAVLNKCSGTIPGAGAHPDCIQLWSVAGHPLESDITVTNNTATGATQGFTDFDQGLRINFSDNTVNTSYPAGVACYDCIDSKITNNTLSTLAGAAYQTRVIILGGSGNTVTGNVVAPYVAARTSGAGLGDAYAGGDGPAFDLALLGPPAQPSGPAMLLGAALSEDAPAAVPEPSSWALLIAGFAAVGVARRRAVAAGRTA